jgi:predicted DNA-binding protein YlxM (UPF0122 family)
MSRAKTYRCKLTEDEVRVIKSLIDEGLKDAEIAKAYPVTRGAIYHIRKGTLRKDIV